MKKVYFDTSEKFWDAIKKNDCVLKALGGNNDLAYCPQDTEEVGYFLLKLQKKPLPEDRIVFIEYVETQEEFDSLINS